MSKNIYMAIDYRHDNGKMRAMAVVISRSRNFKAVIDEDVYIKNAFYIMICESQKEMNQVVEQWNDEREKNDLLMSWDEMTEVIK